MKRVCDAILSSSACFSRQKHCLQLVHFVSHLILSFFHTYRSIEYRLIVLSLADNENDHLTSWWWWCYRGGSNPTFLSLRRALIYSLILSFNSSFSLPCQNEYQLPSCKFFSLRCVMHKSSEMERKNLLFR